MTKTSIERGCLLEQESQFIQLCRTFPEKCEICTSEDGSVCNRRTLEIGTCVECDSGKDKKCVDKPEAFAHRLCGSVGSTMKEGCYLRIDQDHVTRGCVEDLPIQLKRMCLSQSDECKTCHSKDCNLKANFQSCYDCNSRYDPDCTRINNSSQTTICKDYYNNCMTGIDNKGNTHRGCSNGTVDESIITRGFEICNETECNKNIYPEDRLQCYQCDGSISDCDYLASDDKAFDLKPCDILSEQDQCFTFLTAGNKSITKSRGHY